MTNLTARKLFNSLYRVLDDNGFKEGVATFIIEQERYQSIPDSSLAMNELYNIAQNPSRSKYALMILTSAVKTYFNRSKEITNRYREQVSLLYRSYVDEPDLSLVLEDDMTTKRIDLSEALNPPELDIFLKMVEAIAEDIEKRNDDGLFEKLISI